MKWSLQGKWIAVGFTLTLLLMSLVVFGSFKNTSEIKQSANRVNHTYKTLNTLTNFYAAMTVAESARRGYIFMGSKQDLDRYETALINIHHELKLLREQIHFSRSQQERFTIFNSLVNQRLSLLEQSIQLYQKDKNSIQSQTEITERSVKIREQILPLISDIKAEEQDYLQNSLQESEYIIHSRIVIEILATILIIVVISCLCIILERQWVKRDKIKSLESSLFQEKKIGEMKVQLFSMVSHEFRTPLSVILLSAQLLREALKDVVNEIQFKNLSRIQYSAKLMNHMLTDILTLTRAEAGKLDCQTQLINIEDFCLNLVEDIQVFNPVTHKIIFINESGIFRGYLDEKLLYSMLTNLLLNAIKYSDLGSQISLILKSEPKFIIFQVIDKGIGISLTEQQKIYEPFYRCQNVDNIVGSGLGLSVVKKCVECHQGEINLESQVGIGTIFTIKIPHPNIE
ncbi:ATP-binding protein [Dolichospermum circinale]|uniref:histidine kinase n=1 Tax=Dolichospermum circinale CS-537/01 TaxID=3021739 RepID=A0ABT5A0B2_9CYAN|nr:ATP-binding protein [Dolichospermum circinale]MDB9457949.1 ATP-binding protein [Dolichospermum circinale CS-545/17]MDB9468251.1 ATP-binding protein [Dolichospermum circinale CS-539/09]MDB9470112.1 ATP-binding protein [Dolichospermum circinale CS-539]MDB9485327.1 ATP-binding protein [Dolichospermum circinale CS-537/01]